MLMFNIFAGLALSVMIAGEAWLVWILVDPPERLREFRYQHRKATQ